MGSRHPRVGEATLVYVKSKPSFFSQRADISLDEGRVAAVHPAARFKLVETFSFFTSRVFWLYLVFTVHIRGYLWAR